tara:strand:+ start:2267 stop:2488 length:222 start_codon:yes stop_codon:yes gene_type:complete
MREDYLNSDTTSSPKDKEFENILRPKSFKDFYGQEQIISNIKVFVKAAKKRSEPLIMLYYTVHQVLAKQHYPI